MLFVECLQKRGTERLALGKGVQRLYRVLLVEWSHRIAMKLPHGNPKPKLKFPTCIGIQVCDGLCSLCEFKAYY